MICTRCPRFLFTTSERGSGVCEVCRRRSEFADATTAPSGMAERIAAGLGIGPSANEVRSASEAERRAAEADAWRRDRVSYLVARKGWSEERADGFLLGVLIAAEESTDDCRRVVERAIDRLVRRG